MYRKSHQISIKNGKIDPSFKKYFKIETDTVYLSNVQVQEKVKARFERSWRRFYNKATPTISESRQEQFARFFRRLEGDGCDERFTRRVDICFINPVVGYGVFARENIPPYSTLNHYAGVLMLSGDIGADHNSTFSFNDFKTFSIDAMKHGNWCRFMNHCPERQPKNNTISWEYYHASGPKIVFTSGPRGIKRGAQLLYSYGDSYWGRGGQNYIPL